MSMVLVESRDVLIRERLEGDGRFGKGRGVSDRVVWSGKDERYGKCGVIIERNRVWSGDGVGYGIEDVVRFDDGSVGRGFGGCVKVEKWEEYKKRMEEYGMGDVEEVREGRRVAKLMDCRRRRLWVRLEREWGEKVVGIKWEEWRSGMNEVELKGFEERRRVDMEREKELMERWVWEIVGVVGEDKRKWVRKWIDRKIR